MDKQIEKQLLLKHKPGQVVYHNFKFYKIKKTNSLLKLLGIPNKYLKEIKHADFKTIKQALDTKYPNQRRHSFNTLKRLYDVIEDGLNDFIIGLIEIDDNYYTLDIKADYLKTVKHPITSEYTSVRDRINLLKTDIHLKDNVNKLHKIVYLYELLCLVRETLQKEKNKQHLIDLAENGGNLETKKHLPLHSFRERIKTGIHNLKVYLPYNLLPKSTHLDIGT